MSYTNNTSHRRESKLKLEILQRYLLQFAKYFKYTGASYNEDVVLDLTDIVWILQSLGFKITRVDDCDANEICPLQNREGGLRIVTTCSHSGQRCIMEYPIQKNNCNCVPPNKNRDTIFWEKIAKISDITYSMSKEESHIAPYDTIPPIPNEKKHIIKYIIHFVAEMLRDDTILTKYNNTMCGKKHASTSPMTPPRPTVSVGEFLKGKNAVPGIVVSKPKEDEGLRQKLRSCCPQDPIILMKVARMLLDDAIALSNVNSSSEISSTSYEGSNLAKPDISKAPSPSVLPVPKKTVSGGKSPTLQVPSQSTKGHKPKPTRKSNSTSPNVNAKNVVRKSSTKSPSAKSAIPKVKTPVKK